MKNKVDFINTDVYVLMTFLYTHTYTVYTHTYHTVIYSLVFLGIYRFTCCAY